VVLFRENHISGAVESCDVGNPGTLRDDKKERVSEKRGPLPKDRTVVGTVGRRQQPFFVRNQKSHNLSG
jgi:hypothetical protein